MCHIINVIFIFSNQLWQRIASVAIFCSPVRFSSWTMFSTKRMTLSLPSSDRPPHQSALSHCLFPLQFQHHRRNLSPILAVWWLDDNLSVRAPILLLPPVRSPPVHWCYSPWTPHWSMGSRQSRGSIATHPEYCVAQRNQPVRTSSICPGLLAPAASDPSEAANAAATLNLERSLGSGGRISTRRSSPGGKHARASRVPLLQQGP